MPDLLKEDRQFDIYCCLWHKLPLVVDIRLIRRMCIVLALIDIACIQ